MGLSGSKQATTFASLARQHIYNMDKAKLAELLETKQEEFTGANITDEICVDLIQRRWDSATIMRFAEKVSDHQLALFIATAILQRHVVPLGPLFERMKDAPGTIKSHRLYDLFLTCVASEDTASVEAMIKYKCYTENDPLPPRLATRLQMTRSVPDERYLALIYEALLKSKEQVEAVKEALELDGKKEGQAKAKEVIESILCKYLP